SADLARCAEKADEGFSEVVAHAADRVRRAELLIGEVGTERRGKNDQTAAAILGDEQRVGVLARLAGGTKPPTRWGDAARVHGLHRRVEQLIPLEEEWPLLGEKDGE